MLILFSFDPVFVYHWLDIRPCSSIRWQYYITIAQSPWVISFAPLRNIFLYPPEHLIIHGQMGEPAARATTQYFSLLLGLNFILRLCLKYGNMDIVLSFDGLALLFLLLLAKTPFDCRFHHTTVWVVFPWIIVHVNGQSVVQIINNSVFGVCWDLWALNQACHQKLRVLCELVVRSIFQFQGKFALFGPCERARAI